MISLIILIYIGYDYGVYQGLEEFSWFLENIVLSHIFLSIVELILEIVLIAYLINCRINSKLEDSIGTFNLFSEKFSNKSASVKLQILPRCKTVAATYISKTGSFVLFAKGNSVDFFYVGTSNGGTNSMDIKGLSIDELVSNRTVYSTINNVLNGG